MSEESVIGKHIWYREEAHHKKWTGGVLLKFDVADHRFNLNTERVEKTVVAVVKSEETGMVVVIPAHKCINFNSIPRD